jgi:GH15 family glucan-1,4-alpha-glucosidase
MAQYELEIGNAEIAHQTLAWTKRHMLASGVLSEQVDPQTGANIGIAPLTWSHAEYIATLLDTITEISAHSDK